MKTLSIVFCDNGKTVEHDVRDPEIARYLKVNDLNTGHLLKTCGSHIVNRQFFYRDTAASLDSEQLPDEGAQQPPVGGAPLDDKYKLVTVVSYDADTQFHQLQLSPEPQESPSSPTPSFSVDLGESDVGLASPRPTVCQTRSSPVSPGQKRKKLSCYKIVPLKVEQESLPSDATQLAPSDSKRAQFINIPLSAETTGCPGLRYQVVS